MIYLNKHSFIKLLTETKQTYRIKMEDREKLGYNMYGLANHAEFLDYVNPHDGDWWDIIIPGYDYKIKKKEFLVDSILGYIWMEDGNYKIIVDLKLDKFNLDRFKNDIQLFLKNYKIKNSHLNPKLVLF